jgi:hypothetical protein
MSIVRRRYRVVILAAIVVALIVPVGFALSLSPSSIPRQRAGLRDALPVESVVSSAPVLIERERGQDIPFSDVPDAAKLFLAGTALLGLAIAVRKTA